MTRKRHTRASGGPARDATVLAAVATEEPTFVAETLLYAEDAAAETVP